MNLVQMSGQTIQREYANQQAVVTSLLYVSEARVKWVRTTDLISGDLLIIYRMKTPLFAHSVMWRLISELSSHRNSRTAHAKSTIVVSLNCTQPAVITSLLLKRKSCLLMPGSAWKTTWKQASRYE
jgi:hypothetical protein